MLKEAKKIMRLSQLLTEPVDSVFDKDKRVVKIMKEIHEATCFFEKTASLMKNQVEIYNSCTLIFESIEETLNGMTPRTCSLSVSLGFENYSRPPSHLDEPLVHQTCRRFGKACGQSLEMLLRDIDDLHLNGKLNGKSHDKYLALIGAWVVESSDGETFLSQVRALVQKMKMK